jgi:integrative and conjugative element protein (TIGR02256 family)
VFHDVPGTELGCSEQNISLARLKGILRAVGSQPSIRPIALHVSRDAGRRREILTVDVEAAVPQDANVDIRAVERIAICCDATDVDYPAVVALRRTFPRTSHQLVSPVGEPRALCLYDTLFDEQRLVWNPAEFLARIQSWLERTALGTLHPDDQPIEPFFHESGPEILISSSLSLEPTGSGAQWTVGTYVQRTDDESSGFTCQIEAASEDAVDRTHRSGHAVPRALVVVAAPHEHGLMHAMPATLGGLVRLLEPLGVDVRTIIRESIRTMTRGATWSDQDPLIVILRIPLLRHGVVAGESLAAFVFRDYLGVVSERMDAATALVDGHRRAVELLRPDDAKADALEIAPCNAFRNMAASDARAVSGASINSVPHIVLLGAGAIGSHVASHLVRSGWATLTIVDHDHVREHNLVRHILPRSFIGRNKAIAIRDFLGTLWPDADVVAIPRRAASATGDATLRDRLGLASVIVDCSASQAAARTATLDWTSNVQRLSAFLTPDGAGGAVLAEGVDRQVPLDAVEAQYYRLLLRDEIGDKHLFGRVAAHRYGMGCRDRTFVVAPETIALYAGLFVRDIRAATNIANASISIFTTDEEGGVSCRRFPVAVARRATYMSWSIVYDVGLLAILQRLRDAKPAVETGGVLVGYYDTQRRNIYVVDALDAPPDSIEAPEHFIRGMQGLDARLAAIHKRTGGMLRMLGDWHSHPPRVPASPSGDDVELLVDEGLIMADDALPGLIAIVGEHDVTFVCAAETE